MLPAAGPAAQRPSGTRRGDEGQDQLLTFIKFRWLYGGFKQEVRNLTNWQQRRQSNVDSRIRALRRGRVLRRFPEGPTTRPGQAWGGAELAPLWSSASPGRSGTR
ncbi:hypothetical protein GCM10027318_43180 [Massilia agilis]